MKMVRKTNTWAALYDAKGGCALPHSSSLLGPCHSLQMHFRELPFDTHTRQTMFDVKSCTLSYIKRSSVDTETHSGAEAISQKLSRSDNQKVYLKCLQCFCVCRWNDEAHCKCNTWPMCVSVTLFEVSAVECLAPKIENCVESNLQSKLETINTFVRDETL